MKQLLIKFKDILLDEPFEKYPKVEWPDWVKPGSIVLFQIESNFGKAISRLTKSKWTHVAIYIGKNMLLESHVNVGVRLVHVDHYATIPRKIMPGISMRLQYLQNYNDFITKVYYILKLKYKYNFNQCFQVGWRMLFNLPIPRKYYNLDPKKLNCVQLVNLFTGSELLEPCEYDNCFGKLLSQEDE